MAPQMQVEVESGYEWKAGSSPQLWPQSTVSVHRVFDQHTHSAASVSLSPLAVSSVDWSYSSPLFSVRSVEQELSCSVNGQKLSVEQRLSYHLDRRKKLKVYVKIALSIPHNLTSTAPQPAARSTPSALAPEAPTVTPSAFTAAQFEPSLTVGSHYTPSPSHSIGLWLTAAHRGVMAGVSYRFTSFSLTLPIHLTPQYDNKAAAVGLLLPFCVLVASRAAWVWHERHRRQRDWKRHLNHTAQRLLASRLALRAHMLSFRHAARVSRRKNRRSGGLIIACARWVWSDEGGADETMIGSVDVTDALQVHVDDEGRLQLDRAADVIRDSVEAVPGLEGQGAGQLVRAMAP